MDTSAFSTLPNALATAPIVFKMYRLHASRKMEVVPASQTDVAVGKLSVDTLDSAPTFWRERKWTEIRFQDETRGEVKVWEICENVLEVTLQKRQTRGGCSVPLYLFWDFNKCSKKSWWWQDFLIFQTVLGPTQPHVKWLPCLSGGGVRQGLLLTNHSLLVPRSRKIRAVPQPYL